MICIVNKNYRKSLLTPFIGLWFIIISLYSLRLGGLFNVHGYTFKMYLLGIVSFFIGYVCIPYKYKLISNYIHEDKRGNIKIKLLLYLCYIGILVLILKSFKALPYWLSGNSEALKSDIIMNQALSVHPLVEICYIYISRPMQKVLVIFSIVLVFQKSRPEYFNKIVRVAIILTLLCYICTGSKFALSEIIIAAVGYVYMFTRLSIVKLIKRYKKLVLLAVSSFILIFIAMSITGDPGGSLYRYLCGCIPCSDTALIRLQGSPYMFGSVSFNGLLRVITVLPSSLGLFSSIKDLLDVAFEFMGQFEETTYIGFNQRYNAFVSMFTYFFADGGYYGVGILSLIYGMFAALVLKIALHKPTYQSVALVLLIFLFLMTSMVRMQTYMVYYAESIILILCLLPKDGLKLNKK